MTTIGNAKEYELAERWVLDVPTHVRIVTGHLSPLDVAVEDPDLPDTVELDALLSSRLRMTPSIRWSTEGFFDAYRLTVDAQLRMTPWGGVSPPAMAHDPLSQWLSDAAALTLHQAFIEARGAKMGFKVGLVRPHFGVGLVANAGEDATPRSVRESPFGYAKRGDRVGRLQVAYFPLGVVEHPVHGAVPPVVVFGAGDMVVDDDVRRLGDRVGQGLVGVMLNTERVLLHLGLGRRHQTHGTGGETEVDLGVLYGRATLIERSRWSLWAEGEMAGYSGTSTLSESVTDPSPVDMLSAGSVLRLGLTHRDFEAVIEGGVASGDDSPFDREAHGFTFDRDYRVGVLLFNELGRANSAVEALNLTDETYRRRPPRGYAYLPTAGAVRNAVYLNPRGVLKLTNAAALYAGYLYAMAEESPADAFQSGLQGGQPVGHRGARDAQLLGHELDVAVDYHLDGILMSVAHQVRVKATFAVLFPGRAFDNAVGDAAETVYGAWLQGEARW